MSYIRPKWPTSTLYPTHVITGLSQLLSAAELESDSSAEEALLKRQHQVPNYMGCPFCSTISVTTQRERDKRMPQKEEYKGRNRPSGVREKLQRYKESPIVCKPPFICSDITLHSTSQQLSSEVTPGPKQHC